MMKNKILLLCFIALSVINGMAQGQKNTGEWYLGEMQYQKARNLLLKQLQSNPSDVKTMNLLGDAYLGLNKKDSAKTMYQKAFALNPKDPFVLVNLGKIALLEGNREAELDYFDKARKQDRKNPEVYCRIAESCLNLSKKDTTTGNNYLNQGLEVNSKYPCFHMAKGDWEAFNKNYGRAANAYERAIFFDPNNLIAHRKLGEIYAAARFNRQSLDTYNKCIQMEPDQILVYKDLGDLYYSLGRYAEAEKNYDIYLSKADLNVDDKERYAIILFFNKKYNESAKVLEDVLKKNQETNQGVLLRIRGYIAYETADYKGGLDYMNKFFQIQDPKKIIASDYLYYGKLLEKNNMDAQAMDNYKKALAMDSTKTAVYENLASLASKNKLRPEAIQYYNKMMELGYDKAGTNYAIGKEAFSEGYYKYKPKNDSLLEAKKKGLTDYKDSTVVRDSMRYWYQIADSAFARVTRLSPDYALAYIYKGRTDNFLDPNYLKDEAKNSYESALAIMEKDNTGKYKGYIIEAYKYLGAYYFFKSEAEGEKAQKDQLLNTSKEYWMKILAIDPNDPQAKKVIEQLEQAGKRPAKPSAKPK